MEGTLAGYWEGYRGMVESVSYTRVMWSGVALMERDKRWSNHLHAELHTPHSKNLVFIDLGVILGRANDGLFFNAGDVPLNVLDLQTPIPKNFLTPKRRQVCRRTQDHRPAAARRSARLAHESVEGSLACAQGAGLGSPRKVKTPAINRLPFKSRSSP